MLRISSVMSGLVALALCATPLLTPVSAQEKGEALSKVTENQVRDFLKTQTPDLKEEVVKDGKGQQLGRRFFANYKFNGATLPIEVEVRNRVIWLNCWLGKMQPASSLNGDHLVQLLTKQLGTGPSYFSILETAQGPYLRMSHRVETTISMQRLVEVLDEFSNDINDSRNLWQQLVKN